MVGVPRSKGCRICVQRRVKCDQTRPTCNNCKKGNRPCPGYNHDLKFQDEGARLRRRFAGTEAPFPIIESSRASTDSPPDSTGSADSSARGQSPTNNSNKNNTDTSHNNKNVADAELGDHWDVVGLDVNRSNRRAFLGLLEGKTAAYDLSMEDPPEFAYDFPLNIDNIQSRSSYLFKDFGGIAFPNMVPDHINSPHMAQRQLVTAFSASLYPDNNTLPEYLKNHARWLQHLPPLTGTNILLDTAVRAVTLVHIGRLNNSEPFVRESRPYYGKALNLLNKTLQNKEKGTENETLCAVILLSFYEMFASDNNEAWVRHAGGVSALMRARGAARHRHGLDREIFLAYRYMLIIETFQQDVPCFLAEPEWINLSNTIHDDLKKTGISPERAEIFDLAEEYYQAMVILPALTAKARAIWDARQAKRPPPVSRAHLIDDMSKSRIQFKNTFARFEAALKRAGHAPTIRLNHKDPLVGIEYEYVNTFCSSTFVGYWTVLVVQNKCLQGLQADDKDMVEMYGTESKECALNICRSTTYMLTSSFLGPFFLIFGLRVGLLVFEDADGPESDWILRKLFAIGDKHMGIAKHVPGYRPGITADELIREFKIRKAQAKQDSGPSEDLQFVRQVAHGEIYDQNGQRVNQGVEPVIVWEPFNQTEDVLQVWEDQANFPILEMDSLNVESASGAGTRQTSPMPPMNNDGINTFVHEQTQQTSVPFMVPDPQGWDQNWGNIHATTGVTQQRQQQQDFLNGEMLDQQQSRDIRPKMSMNDGGISRFLLKDKHWNGGRMKKSKVEQKMN